MVSLGTCALRRATQKELMPLRGCRRAEERASEAEGKDRLSVLAYSIRRRVADVPLLHQVAPTKQERLEASKKQLQEHLGCFSFKLSAVFAPLQLLLPVSGMPRRPSWTMRTWPSDADGAEKDCCEKGSRQSGHRVSQMLESCER